MIFCGQCGLQLPPGTTHCPRCGATVDESASTSENMHVDDPTVASQSFVARHPAGQGQPGVPGTPPQQLILRPGQNDFTNQGANDATSMMETPYRPSGPANMGASFAGGYPAQGQGNYPDYGTHGGYATPGNTYHPGMTPAYAQGHEQEEAQGNKKLRAAALVIVVLGLVLILVAVVLFALQQNKLIAYQDGNTLAIVSAFIASNT